MSESILQCSGGHWVRAALTWACLTIAIAVNLPRGEADEPARRARHLAKAEAATVISAVQLSPHIQTTVTPFDFNAAAMTAYGDAEPSEPAQR